MLRFLRFQVLVDRGFRKLWQRQFHDPIKTGLIDAKKKLVYGGDLNVEIPLQSTGSLLFNRMLRLDRRNEILQISAETNEKVTTKMFLERSVGLAERLKEEGAKKGDFIYLIGNNSLNMNVCLFGILLLAAVPVPLSHRTSLDELGVIANSIKPNFLGCQKKFLKFFKPVLDSSTLTPPKTFLIDDEDDSSGFVGFKKFIQGRGGDYENFKPTDVENPKEELALAMKALTDGVPGRLVGVTHYNITSVIARYDNVDDGVFLRSKIYLMVQKVLWMSGAYTLILSCSFGSKVIVMSKFNAENILQSIANHKVTDVYMFSAKWWELFKHTTSATYDLSSCRFGFSVNSPLPKMITDRLQAKYNLKVRSAYGITELTGFVLLPTDSSAQEDKKVGTLVSQVYAKVVSLKTGQNLSAGEQGELCFKGPITTKGYINNKKLTQLLFDKEGFLLTGQYGYYNNLGEFFVIEKIIHQIHYKGHKISPKELEGLVKYLDPVKDVCVTGISHPRDGEYPIALVVLQKGHKLSEDDIIRFVHQRVEDFKKLRGGVIFVSKIPRFRETGSIKREKIKKIMSKYRMKTSQQEVDTKKKKENLKNGTSSSIL